MYIGAIYKNVPKASAVHPSCVTDPAAQLDNSRRFRNTTGPLDNTAQTVKSFISETF